MGRGLRLRYRTRSPIADFEAGSVGVGNDADERVDVAVIVGGVEWPADVALEPLRERDEPRKMRQRQRLFESRTRALLEAQQRRIGADQRARSVDPATNGFWKNQSFHNYADYATTKPFHAGLGELLKRGGQKSSAIMCSEAVWWRCHRRIVADYLLNKGCAVYHLMGAGRVEPAKMTPAATPVGSCLIYPDEPAPGLGARRRT